MLLYSCLHLAGFKLSMDDIKQFRQLKSLTPGHPEFHVTEGVEATTGPLGQGVANAVGQALGLKLLGKKFNTDKFTLFNSKVYCLAGDGCIMEGISSEASSLAGHLALDNIVLVYDANKVTLDGFLSESCSEDTKMRYRSYGWDVYDVDGFIGQDLAEVLDRFHGHATLGCGSDGALQVRFIDVADGRDAAGVLILLGEAVELVGDVRPAPAIADHADVDTIVRADNTARRFAGWFG